MLSEILPVQIRGACCAGNDARHNDTVTTVSPTMVFMALTVRVDRGGILLSSGCATVIDIVQASAHTQL